MGREDRRIGLKRFGGWRGAAVALVITAAAAAVFVPGSVAASCTGTTWADTSTSGDWNTASSWSPATVPTSSTTVCLPSGSYTVSVTGASSSAASVSIGSGVTLDVVATQSSGSQLALNSGTSSNNGTFELTDNAVSSSSQKAELLLNSGSGFTNDGTIISDAGGGFGARAIDSQTATSVLNNASDGTMTVNYDLQLGSGSQSGLFQTSGNITIASGKKLLAFPNGGGVGGNPAKQSAEMDINGGTITDNGTFGLGITEAGGIGGAAALEVNGGTISGTSASTGLIAVSGSPTDMAGSGVGASFSGSGSGTYTFVGSLSANQTTLGGTIDSNQTLTLSGSTSDGTANVIVNPDVTNDGTIELTDSDTSGNNTNAALLGIAGGHTLTNNGTITSDPGPGGKGQRIIGTSASAGTLANTSSATINVNQDLQLFQQGTGVFTTTGTINVASGKTFEIDPNGGGVNNLNGGAVNDSGTTEIGINSAGNTAGGAALNVNGGTVTGTPIVSASAITTFSGSGTGSFTLEGGGSTLAGTIGSNDTVALSGTTGPAGSVNVTTSGTVANDGTLTMTDPDSGASASAFAGLVIPSNSSFTNNATMTSDPGPAGSGYRSIDGTVANSADGVVNVNMELQLGLHAGSAFQNAGTVHIAAGQAMPIGGFASTYTQSAGTTTLGGGAARVNTNGGVLLNGGTLAGSGTIGGDLVNAASVSPGPSPATIAVTGSYTQTSGGTLSAQATASGNDLLDVTGTAALDGTLHASSANGFTPSVGQTFQILTASSVSGHFAAVTGPYSATYDAGDVKIVAQAANPAVSFSATQLTFGSASNTVAAGATVTQPLTVTNSGFAPLNVSGLSLSGPQASSFALSGDGCSGASVPAGGSCSVTVGFSPAAAGSYSATLSVPDNAAGSPQQIALSGIAGAAGPRIGLSAASVDFGPVGVGVPFSKAITVTSTGSAPLDISSAAFSGASAAEFSLASDTCAGATLAPGATCTTWVSLKAAATGSRVGQLLYADNAPDSPQAVALSGTGTTSGLLTGHVHNAAVSGNPPAAGASVLICQSANPHPACQSSTTAADGSYSIDGLSPGLWKMDVSPTQGYLTSGTAIVTIAAGPQTQDFTLQHTQALPPGITVNGGTGCCASSWTSNDAVQVPVDPVPKGTPGWEGVSITTFWAEPAGATGLQPYAFARIEVEYRYDSAGIPRLVATLAGIGQTSGIGVWETSLAPPPGCGTSTTKTTNSPSITVNTACLLAALPRTGEDVRGMNVQGLFIPTNPPLHGALDYEIGHDNVFWNPAAATAADANPGQQTGTATRGPTLVPGTIPIVAQPAPKPPCPPGPSYGGKGRWELPDVGTWDASLSMLTRDDGSTIQLAPGIGLQGENLDNVPVIAAEGPPGPNTTLGNNTFIIWSQANGFKNNTGQPTVAPDGEVPDFDLLVSPYGQSFVDVAPGPDSARYQFNRDGSFIDTFTGTTYGAAGLALSQSTPKGAPCGPNGGGPNPPPPAPGQPAPPSPQPNSPTPQNSASWKVRFPWYKDPSGLVLSAARIPVPAAKVVLSRAPRAGGAFSSIPNGSPLMSPGNRRNPDRTTALGGFGWDVAPGVYKVTAQRSGCTAAHGHGRSVHTPALTVPPEVFNLKLVLRCPHLRRTRTRTTLKARAVPVNEVALVVGVSGRRPQGVVAFKKGRRTLATVPLNPRTHQAIFTTHGKRKRGFRAVYEGDGYNAPSSGAG